MKTKLVNDLLLKTLALEKTPRIPVWMMRQAGRYLPEYMQIRRSMTFMDLCKNPIKAAEVSVQPYEILGLDAIIMFSDILIPLEAMGAGVHFDNGKPEFREVLDSPDKINKLKALSKEDLSLACDFTFETIRNINSLCHSEVPVLGFAGAPWTLASYLIEGGGSKDFSKIKSFMYNHPQAMHNLLENLSSTIAEYLILKFESGVDAVQIFDTWAGMLSQKDFQDFALPYVQKIIQKIRSKIKNAKIIFYINGVGNLLDQMMISGADCLGIDWRVSLKDVRAYIAGQGLAVQGNLDPAYLLGPRSSLISKVEKMLEEAGPEPGYIANLGHGILPNVPVENARAFIETVKKYKFERN